MSIEEGFLYPGVSQTLLCSQLGCMFFFSLREKRVFRSVDGWVRDGVKVAVAQLSARGFCFGTEEEGPLVRRAWD